MKKLLILIPILAMTLPVLADTTITYQGQLQENGQPFNGTADMEFELFDGEPGDNPVSVAGPITIAGVSVSDGLFQVELDFGDAPYEEGLRLRITVDGDELSPLQPITAAPLAVRSLSGGSVWTTLSNQRIHYGDGNVAVGGTTPSSTGTFVVQSRASDHAAFSARNSTGALILGTRENRGVMIGAPSPLPPSRGLRVFGDTLLDSKVGIGTANPESQFTVSGQDSLFVAGDFVGGGFAATAHKPGANTAFLAGPEGSQSAFFIGDPVVLGSNTDLHMSSSGRAELRGSVEVGEPQFDPDPGGLRAEGSIVAEGDFLAAFGELQMATSAMPGGSSSVCRSTTGSFQVLGFCSSSSQYKQDIEDLHSATELINQLRAVSFRWEETGELDIGLIAEEVAAIDPRLATFDEDGNVQGVKYRHLAAVLVKALQEQEANTSAEIAALQAELDGQRRKTAERLAALEALLLDGAEVAAK